MYLKHRNSQKRIIFNDAIYFVTCKTKGNYPYFKEQIFYDLFIENLRICKKIKGFQIFGWVLICDHFHLMIMPWEEFGLSKIIQFLKRHVTRDINYIFNPYEGEIRESRLRGGYYEKFEKLILEHDNKLKSYQSEFLQKYPNNEFPKFQWQSSYHDHYIRNENDFNKHMEYILYNPEKHGLPKDWKYIFTNPEFEYLLD